MPTLSWIGKDAVVNHDKHVPFRLLRKVKSASVGESSNNLIVHGDNLEGLKALMPHYVSRVKCVYIDPPYNTGSESWVYNDKVNSPKIRKWLGKIVGPEAEDLSRHDKWLCMMYPRLKLLRDLLKEDGAIFVSIDDNEHANLKSILDEIFGAANFVTNIIWQKKYTQSNDAKYISSTHDFIVCYAKNKSKLNIHLMERTGEQTARYKNPDNDPRGPWMSQPIQVKTPSDDYIYEIENTVGQKFMPPLGRSWQFSKERYRALTQDNRIWFGADGKNVPRLKKFLSEVKEGVIPKSIWLYSEVGSNDEAKQELKSLLKDVNFDSPKPVRLIQRIVSLITDTDDIVLDSFAGSGTTGHAVMRLNKEDGGKRKFILVELEDRVALPITAERIKQAIKLEGLEGDFEYCELTKPLFSAEGQVDESCDFNQLATYIFFTETQTNLNSKIIKGSAIGSYAGTDYYLLFKERGRNILDHSFINKLAPSSNRKVIYADQCLVDELTLQKYNILFKQIPYEIKIY